MQLVDFMRETENKMLHLHKAIDKVSTEPDFRESVSVLTEVIKDYQMQLEKVKTALNNVHFNQQGHASSQNGGTGEHQV